MTWHWPNPSELTYIKLGRSDKQRCERVPEMKFRVLINCVGRSW